MRILFWPFMFLPFWARLVVGAGVALSLASVLACALWFCISRALGRRRPRYWRRVFRAHLLLVPLFFLVGEPLLVGSFATHFETRGDESGYRGPRLDASGAIVPQDRTTLRAERIGETTVDPAALAAADARAVHFTATDGVRLRGFHVPARATPARFAVVLAHGLFRGALEIEPVGAMFRELGGEILLLELRNHGKSGRARPAFGLDESRDVIAAATWLRSRAGSGVPLVLFGVSLGSAAVAIGAPEVERAVGLDGLVLDSTMASLADTANNFLSERMEMPHPWRGLTLFCIESITRTSFGEIRPDLAAARLSPAIPVLVIGGGEDKRTPPDGAVALYRALAAPEGTKEIWIRPGSDHGHVWIDAPEEYAARLKTFVDRVCARSAAH